MNMLKNEPDRVQQHQTETKECRDKKAFGEKVNLIRKIGDLKAKIFILED